MASHASISRTASMWSAYSNRSSLEEVLRVRSRRLTEWDRDATGQHESHSRRTGPGAKGDIILLMSDLRHIRWAHALLLNLRALKLKHTCVLAPDESVCTALDARVGVPREGCGTSTFLRGEQNASIDAALRRWRIGPMHVYHLWWQRWRWMADVASIGYNALSLDTDMGVRADPYPLLSGPLRHRQLITALDTDGDGKKNHYFFPGINVGLVYVQGKPNGAAHALLAAAAERFERLLLGPVVRAANGRPVELLLWEQDTMKDLLESAAFNLTNQSFRHVLYYVGRSPAEMQPWAKRLRWERESVRTSMELMPSVSVPWLSIARLSEGAHYSLNNTDASDDRTAGTAAHGAAFNNGGGDVHAERETVAGLPGEVISGYGACPGGHECLRGAWAVQPSPVLVVHMVGQRSKFFLMRILGFWDFRVELHDLEVPPASLTNRPFRRSGAPPQERIEWRPTRRRATVFDRGDSKLLVLRGHHKLRFARGHSTPMVDLMRRLMALAFSLGRVAVLPYLGCDLMSSEPKLTREVRDLRFEIVPLRDGALCDATAAVSNWSTQPQLPLGWRPNAAISMHKLRKRPFTGCCVLLPPHRCFDTFGTKRALRHEAILSERDYGHFLYEQPFARPQPASSSTPFSELETSEPSKTLPASLVISATMIRDAFGLGRSGENKSVATGAAATGAGAAGAAMERGAAAATVAAAAAAPMTAAATGEETATATTAALRRWVQATWSHLDGNARGRYDARLSRIQVTASSLRAESTGPANGPINIPTNTRTNTPANTPTNTPTNNPSNSLVTNPSNSPANMLAAATAAAPVVVLDAEGATPSELHALLPSWKQLKRMHAASRAHSPRTERPLQMDYCIGGMEF